MTTLSQMDWTKHATRKKGTPVLSTPRRIPVTVSPEMQKLIAHFKTTHPDHDFSDTAILHTLLEAGARAYVNEFVLKPKQMQTSSSTQTIEDDDQPADHPDV